MSDMIDVYSASRQASIMSAQFENATTSETGTEKALAPLLGGKSLTVTEMLGGDLQALLEKLKSEQDRTRFSLLLSSLQSINESLSDSQRIALQEGVELSEQLDEYNMLIDEQTKSLAAQQAASAVLAAKIEMLQNQIDLAVQEGKDHIELVKEQNRVREEQDAKKQVINETIGKINEINNKIKDVKGKMAVAVTAIGENTLKSIANELSAIIKPSKAESSSEAEKKEAKIAENDFFKPIRMELEKIRQNLQDTIDANTSDIMA